ncbi:nitrite/sulfite reductase, partial [Candidatus Bathyarchaeota archaeon]|nr:nitrite/sulfite reductase [Candidatus Bathyarchaeota archaeon]
MKINMASTEDIGSFIGRYSIGRDDGEGSLHFIRIKVPGGILTSEQLRGISALASKYSRGIAEITDREDIQLHWIRAEDSLEIFSIMDKMGFTTDMCGQGFPGARYGDVRNIICCPASGIEKDEIYNCYPIARELTRFFIGNPEYLDLPRKFKIAMTGCGADCVRAEINDLAFVAVKNDGETGFTILVGGSIGVSLPGPRLASPTGVFIKPEDVFKVTVATIEIFRDYGNRESKSKARFKWLIENWGIEKFLSLLRLKTGVEFRRYNRPIFVKETDHEGVQPQNNDGCYYVNVPILGGRLTSSVMNEIADLADKYGSGELRLTPTQNIIIPNVSEENRELLIEALMDLGFPINASKARWLSIGCASDFCGKTLYPHAKDVVKEIIDYLEGVFGQEKLRDMRLRVNVSGCSNDCGASLVADIGLVGKQVREGDRIKQAYDIYVGGSLGNNPSLGKLIAERVPAEKTKFMVASFIANYLERRKPGEDISGFCRRHRIDELKAFLLSKTWS